MNTSDIFNIQEHEIPYFVQQIEGNREELFETYNSVKRMSINLNALLSAFPNTSPDKKLEIKMKINVLEKLMWNLFNSLNQNFTK